MSGCSTPNGSHSTASGGLSSREIRSSTRLTGPIVCRVFQAKLCGWSFNSRIANCLALTCTNFRTNKSGRCGDPRSRAIVGECLRNDPCGESCRLPSAAGNRMINGTPRQKMHRSWSASISFGSHRRLSRLAPTHCRFRSCSRMSQWSQAQQHSRLRR